LTLVLFEYQYYVPTAPLHLW